MGSSHSTSVRKRNGKPSLSHETNVSAAPMTPVVAPAVISEPTPSMTKTRKKYRDPMPIVKDLQPLVSDIVANVLLISKVTMGRGTVSAKRSASLVIRVLIERIDLLHQTICSTNQQKHGTIDTCVFIMAERILATLWKVVHDKYPQTLVQLQTSNGAQFQHHTPWFCVHHQLHERTLSVFEHVLLLVASANDAQSFEEVRLLLDKSHKSLFVTTRNDFERYKLSLAEVAPKTKEEARSDLDFTNHVVTMIDEALDAVSGLDITAVLATGSLSDTRALPITSPMPLHQRSASMGQLPSSPPLAPHGEQRKSMSLRNITVRGRQASAIPTTTNVSPRRHSATESTTVVAVPTHPKSVSPPTQNTGTTIGTISEVDDADTTTVEEKKEEGERA